MALIQRELTAGVVSWSRAKVVDELFNFFITKNRQVDERTGRGRSTYEKQAEFVLYRLNAYKPPPTFVLYEDDLDELYSQLHKELNGLDDADLDDVMCEAIYWLLDEVNTSEFKIDVLRRTIRWEIK